LLKDPSDALIHPIDLRGVNLHPRRLPCFIRRLLPRRHTFIPVGKPPPRIDDSGIDKPLEALLAQDVPTIVEPICVLGDVLPMRVQRPMRRGVGHEHEQGVVTSSRVVVG
jgi:hypothetical protein